MDKEFVIDAGGQRLDSRAGQIGHTRHRYDVSLKLCRLLIPPLVKILRRNIASIMKILFDFYWQELNERLKKPARKSKPKYRAVLVATLLAVAALVAGLILSDVKSHGGVWEKSDTYRFLKTKGIISVTTYIWAGLQHFYHVSYE